MTVHLIRMWSGEDVIADIVEDKGDSIVITDPIVAVPAQTEGRIAFAPWSPFLKRIRLRLLKSILYTLVILKHKLSNNIILCLVRSQTQLKN